MFNIFNRLIGPRIIFKPTRQAAKTSPPVPLKKVIPDWYKKLPNYYAGSSSKDINEIGMVPATIKRCVPVLDFLTCGYALRFPNDVKFSVETVDGVQNYTWFTTNPDELGPLVSIHKHQQVPIPMEGEIKTYIKLQVGWHIKTPPGYSCLFMQSPYDFDSRIKLFPAIVDTDEYDAETLFPGYITAGAPDFEIKAGQHVMNVFPFKREEWGSEIQDALYDERNGLFIKTSKNKLENIYRSIFHKKKSYD